MEVIGIIWIASCDNIANLYFCFQLVEHGSVEVFSGIVLLVTWWIERWMCGQDDRGMD